MRTPTITQLMPLGMRTEFFRRIQSNAIKLGLRPSFKTTVTAKLIKSLKARRKVKNFTEFCVERGITAP